MSKPQSGTTFIADSGTLANDFLAERDMLSAGYVGMDATQLVNGIATVTNVEDKTLIFIDVASSPSTGFVGEPLIRDANNVSAFQHLGIQASTNSLMERRVKVHEETFTLGDSGRPRVIFFYWTGLFILNPSFADTDNSGHNGTWKYATLRLFVDNVEIALRDGPVRCGRGTIFGTTLVTNPTVTVKVTVDVPRLAIAEPVEDIWRNAAIPRMSIFAAQRRFESRS